MSMFNFDPQVQAITDYEYAKEQHKKLQQDIHNLQFTDKLYIEKIAQSLRDLHFYLVMFGEEMFHDLWYFIDHPNETKEDGTKFDTETILDIIKEKIFDKRHIDNAKFTGCLMFNYGDAYEFKYEIYGKKIGFTIPMYSRTTTSNWSSMYYSARYEESEHVWDMITSNIRREKVFKEFNKWLDGKKKVFDKKEMLK